MRRDADTSRSLVLIQGSEDGYYDLPKPVLTARRTFEAIEAARAEAGKTYQSISPGAVQQGVMEAILAKAASGELDMALVQPILDTTTEQVRLSHWQVVLDEAAGRAATALPSVVRKHADEIVTDGLRPALEKVLADLRALQAKVDLRTVPFGNEAGLARADKAVRDAYAKFGDLADTYGLLRGAQAVLRDIVGQPSEEAFARFREFRNAYHVVTGLGSWTAPQPPWEALPGGKLTWIAVTPGVEVWMPTADQCQAANDAKVAAGGLRSATAEGVYVPQS
jgi:hypothetical protein